MNHLNRVYNDNPRSHRDHKEHINRDIWMLICAEFQNKKVIPSISKRAGIPPPTLYTWRKCYQEDKKWSPKNNNWGRKNRIFTEKEENNLASYVSDNIDQGNLSTNIGFREIAIEYYLNIHLGDYIKMFNCSEIKLI